jgi:hypothetical protein
MMEENFVKKIIEKYQQEISGKEIIISGKEEENLGILEDILYQNLLSENTKKKKKSHQGELIETEIYDKLYEKIDLKAIEKLAKKGSNLPSFTTKLKNALEGKTYGEFILSKKFILGKPWLFDGIGNIGQRIVEKHLKKIKLYDLIKNKENLQEIYKSEKYKKD